MPAACDLLYYLVRVVARTCKCFRPESGLEMAELPIMSSVAMALREHVCSLALLYKYILHPNALTNKYLVPSARPAADSSEPWTALD